MWCFIVSSYNLQRCADGKRYNCRESAEKFKRVAGA